MKCILRFPVQGILKVSQSVTIPISGISYDLETSKDGTVTSIRATVSVPTKDRWPVLKTGPQPSLDVRLPLEFPFIQLKLRAVLGLLSFYGLENIDVDNPEIEWIPESEDERKELGITSFKCSVGPPDFSGEAPLEFEMIARAFIAAEYALELELPLSFYRNGQLDVLRQRYIDAIYDFYYLLELLFARGKTNKQQVLKEFRKAIALKDAIIKALNNIREEARTNPTYRQEFEQTFRDINPDGVIGFIVDLRSRLHHQSSKRKGIWHPDQQMRYRYEALFLQRLTFYVLFPKAWSCLENEKVTKTLQALCKKKDGDNTT